MSRLPNFRLYKECPNCGAWSFNQYDKYCSRCATELKEHDRWLAGIADYAKSMLIDFLDSYPDLAEQADIGEIPDYATEGIRANGNILFNQTATRHVLAECWNEVETALDTWREASGLDFPVKNIEQLHVFSVCQHANMVWRKITRDFNGGRLDKKTVTEAVYRLKNR
jgi:ribosomal protein S27AE